MAKRILGSAFCPVAALGALATFVHCSSTNAPAAAPDDVVTPVKASGFLPFDLSDPNASFSATLLIEDRQGGHPSASLTYNGQTYTTGADGRMTIPGVSVRNLAGLRITATGFMPRGVLLQYARAGKQAMRVVLEKPGATTAFSAAAGGSISNGPVNVAFKGGGFVTGTGAAYTGTVHVAALGIDPMASILKLMGTSSELREGVEADVVPQGYELAATKSGAMKFVAPESTFQVELTDDSGASLALAPSTTASARMALAPATRRRAGDTVVTYAFAEDVQRWKEDGTCTVRAVPGSAAGSLECVANVSHFSSYAVSGYDNLGTTCGNLALAFAGYSDKYPKTLDFGGKTYTTPSALSVTSLAKYGSIGFTPTTISPDSTFFFSPLYHAEIRVRYIAWRVEGGKLFADVMKFTMGGEGDSFAPLALPFIKSPDATAIAAVQGGNTSGISCPVSNIGVSVTESKVESSNDPSAFNVNAPLPEVDLCAKVTCASGQICDRARGGCVSTVICGGTDDGCGGTCATTCAAGKKCKANTDCASGICSDGKCAAVTMWAAGPAPTFDTHVRGLVTVDATHTYAAGDNGTVGMFNGTAWTTSVAASGTVLNSIWGWDTTHLWVAGNGGVLKSFDGTNWTTLATGLTGTPNLNSIRGLPGLGVLVAAAGGNISFWTTDAPSADFQNYFAGGAPTANDLNSIFPASTGRFYVAGSAGTIFSQYGMTSGLQTSGTTAKLNAVWGVSDTEAWACGDGGVLLYYDGTTWKSVASGTTANLFSIWASDARHVWVGGANGTILFLDATRVAKVEASGTTGTIRALSGLDSGGISVFAAGDNHLFLTRKSPAGACRTTAAAVSTTQCNHIDVSRDEPVPTPLVAGAAPAQTGGVVRAGRYKLQSVTVYTGSGSADAGSLISAAAATLVLSSCGSGTDQFDAEIDQLATVFGTATRANVSTTLSVSNGQLAFANLCIGGQSSAANQSYAYSADANSLQYLVPQAAQGATDLWSFARE